MSFSIGSQVGPYRILEQLGQGGMATVFKAYHPSLDRYVAIKVLHQAFLEDPNFTARFQREARVVARLEHANIVPIYDYAEHEGRPYLVMKFIEGETLKARLQRGPLAPTEVEEIVTSIGAGLAYAHRQGILHRDIKPSNVMLARDGQTYLADFGLARIAQSGESTLTSDMVLGTPQYISPEQAMAKKDLDEGTDIYSFGVMLYEMTVGRVPFSGDTPFAVIHNHIYAPLPLPSDVNPRIAPELERLLLKTLAKERAERFKDVPEFIRAFKEAWKSQAPTLVTASQPEPVPNAAPVSPAVTGSAPFTVRAEPGTLPPPVTAPTVEAEPQAAVPFPVVPETPPGEIKKRKTLPRWVWMTSTGLLIILGVVAGSLFFLRIRARRLATLVPATMTASVVTDTPLPTPTLPPPSPTSSPEPIVSKLPQPGGILYQTKFDDNKLTSGWVVDAAGWKLENGVLCGKDHTWASYVDGKNWGDYVARFHLQISKGSIHLNLRGGPVEGGINRYFIFVDKNGFALSKQIGNQLTHNLARVKYPFKYGQWYEIELVAQGNRIMMFVNGLRMFEFNDPEPLMTGFPAFETLDASAVCVDDMVVADLTRQPPFDQLYFQPFDTEAALAGWTTTDAQGKPNRNWVIRDGALCGSGHNWVVFTGQSFTNFEETFRITVKGSVNVNFRIRLDPWSRYFLRLSAADGLAPLSKNIGENLKPLVNTGRVNFKPDQWVQVTIIAVDNRIIVRINDRKIYDFTDKEPISEGAIGFETTNEQSNANVCVDDLVIQRPSYIPKP